MPKRGKNKPPPLVMQTPEEMGGQDTRRAEAEARQSEKRFGIDDAIDAGIIRVEGPRQLTAEEVRAAYVQAGVDAGVGQVDVPVTGDEWREKHIGSPLQTAFSDDEWAGITTAEERDAPLCAVMTPDQLAAVLDKAVDDGVSYEKPAAGAVVLDELWGARALVMAEERGLTLKQFLEACVKEAWVRRPLRKRGP